VAHSVIFPFSINHVRTGVIFHKTTYVKEKMSNMLPRHDCCKIVFSSKISPDFRLPHLETRISSPVTPCGKHGVFQSIFKARFPTQC